MNLAVGDRVLVIRGFGKGMGGVIRRVVESMCQVEFDSGRKEWFHKSSLRKSELTTKDGEGFAGS